MCQSLAARCGRYLPGLLSRVLPCQMLFFTKSLPDKTLLWEVRQTLKKKKASKQVLSQVQLEISMQYILAAADYCWKADTVQDAAVTTSPSPAPDNKTI